MSQKKAREKRVAPEQTPPDEELEALRRQRFAERVGRVLEVMREEGIDWRGVAAISADGRIVTRVVPVEARGG